MGITTNELMIRGWSYFKTNKTNAKEAYEEFCKAAEKAGINVDNMGMEVVLRNDDYEDIDVYSVG